MCASIYTNNPYCIKGNEPFLIHCLFLYIFFLFIFDSFRKWFDDTKVRIHRLEVFACIIFYAGTGTNVENMFYVLFVLVGIGTIIHSMVDYYLALAVYKALKKRR